MKVPKLPTREDIAMLPDWYIVAFAVSCAKRVEKFYTIWNGATQEDKDTLRNTINWTEKAASQADASLLEAVKVKAAIFKIVSKAYAAVNYPVHLYKDGASSAEKAVWATISALGSAIAILEGSPRSEIGIRISSMPADSEAVNAMLAALAASESTIAEIIQQDYIKLYLDSHYKN
jgi:hypothetical protein